MKVYKIDIDHNKIQLVLPDIEGLDILKYKIFDGKKKADFWNESIWYVFNPTIEPTNFISMGVVNALIFDQTVYDSELYPMLERAGEILPITLKDKTYYVLNITEVINVLDTQKTVWKIQDDGSKGDISNYYFLKRRFTNSSLFKIPETHTTEIFTYQDSVMLEEDFYSVYQKLNYTGLVFHEVFSE
jgi:hypothetical protein